MSRGRKLETWCRFKRAQQRNEKQGLGRPAEKRGTPPAGPCAFEVFARVSDERNSQL
jgi:hypothetical protein